ncbi:hypothetical protein [Singulisphaera acidiphila]|uniref:Uncharacterized protein n=1 Tax=Singulisphaera acidiphila (strain ATCC BAA-1392 / DSM 18658 / VKM B-2454 / MOB10) TaxID=886293 RepID=L0DHD0_SINAD|nr:hypothetical protein [Singulisphaera acidiphila]AGA28260.1 hypothetical protein Sinac_4038 [Singulisphaera acidiphila DSM 18658]
MQNFLIVAPDPKAYRETDELLRGRNVIARVSPHLIEGRFTAEDIARLPAGVEAFSGPIPAKLLQELPPSARLAAKALVRARGREEPAEEGLPWDAPGFEPPG